ncbi:hypothetical protein F9601_24545 [Escherichia coli]|nr:hypothetical protein [Escherichia coli]EFH4462327.1 hypothetical protein [Escherichia coli]EFH6012675.1 hypothetical protein [Escherichia coli]EFH7308331.1 hypothetical protein [Escherichia coli]
MPAFPATSRNLSAEAGIIGKNALNNRPRKTLKFKTPKEIIERGVALTD